MIRSFLFALSFLTIFPVKTEKFSEKEISRAPVWFPVIGYLIGIFSMALAKILIEKINSLLISFFVLLFIIIITGAFHLDGLADWADGFAGKTPEHRLKIMKDHHHGTFGIIALIMLIFGKFLAIYLILKNDELVFLTIAPGLARLSIPLIISETPYARTEGGCATIFVKGTKKWHPVLAFIIAALLITPFSLSRLPLTIFCISICLLIGFLFRYDAIRRLNGFTGDILGASSELSELAVLLSSSLLSKIL